MLIIELSSEKHALQNIQNDCYEGLSDSCRVRLWRLVLGASRPSIEMKQMPKQNLRLTGTSRAGQNRIKHEAAWLPKLNRHTACKKKLLRGKTATLIEKYIPVCLYARYIVFGLGREREHFF